MSKIVHIVGNRPQFIKLAPVSRALQQYHIEEIIIHTGQHYDENMSNIFFDELDIPYPKENLNVGSGTHAQTTARVMERLEKVVDREKPDGVIIYGDTDSTLAAAVVISKLNIPLFHIEAGPRTYSKTNPEEKNRVVADHLSDYLFVPDRVSAENLQKEGIPAERIIFSGDVMYDEFLYVVRQDNDAYTAKYPADFILMTWHRQENTYDMERMEKIIDFISRINCNIVFPLHPRTKKRLSEYGLWDRIYQNKKLTIMEPVGYREMTVLLNKCSLVVTDSGGVSKEASFAQKRCFFFLGLAVWPELIKSGHIRLIDVGDRKSVESGLSEINNALISDEKQMPKANCFGDGNAAKIIADTIKNIL